jgi:hypothetical protein
MEQRQEIALYSREKRTFRTDKTENERSSEAALGKYAQL